MKPEHKAILTIIEQFLDKYPEQRFGQALFNLNINQFSIPTNPAQCGYLLKDIYNDSDEKILERMKMDI